MTNTVPILITGASGGIGRAAVIAGAGPGTKGRIGLYRGTGVC